MDKTEKKANVIKANYRLQQKVGAGPLDDKAVKASQNVIDTNDVDFEPLGLSILKRLEDGLLLMNHDGISMERKKDLLTTPVMELKANASTFHYTLVGSLANIMLSFLEAIRETDNDAVEIVRAHHKTLHMIIVKKISGDGGAAGKQLTSELQMACDRYYNKKFSR
jgi:hypothetical protein